MGVMIGESSGAYSTWAKLRSPLIGGYDQWEKFVGPGTQFHNIVIDSGFHPDEGLFLRCDQWPYTQSWTDTSSNPHTSYEGPIVGFQNGLGTYPSYFSVGTYDWPGNDTTNPLYTSVNNLLDYGDIDGSLVGLTVTYSGGSFTTTLDAFDNTPISLWFGQDIGYNAITSVTGISSFTAF